MVTSIAKQSLRLQVVVIASLVMSVGCGETNQQVIARYKPQLAPLRTKLSSLTAKLPPVGSVQQMTRPGAVSPPVAFASANQPGNTEILMYDQLVDPDVELETANKLDLHLSRHLLEALRWTGDKNPMASSALNNRDTISASMAAALATKYVVIVRVVEHERPRKVDESTYTGGQAHLEVFLTDLESEQVLGSFAVRAQAPESVTGQEVTTAAHGGLWQAAREEVGKGLEQLTGSRPAE
jgi:hypothetical protein